MEFVIDKYGFPGAVLIALGFALWRFVVWFKPLGARVMLSVAELIESLRTTNEANSRALVGLGSDVRTIADELRAARGTVRDAANQVAQLGGDGATHSG